MQQIGFLVARFMVFILALRIDAAKLVGKGIDETRVEGIKFDVECAARDQFEKVAARERSPCEEDEWSRGRQGYYNVVPPG